MTLLSFKGQAPVMEFCHRDSRMFITNRRLEPRVLLDQIHSFPFPEPNRRRGRSATSDEILSETSVPDSLEDHCGVCHSSFIVTSRLAGGIPGVMGTRRCSRKNSSDRSRSARRP